MYFNLNLMCLEFQTLYFQLKIFMMKMAIIYVQGIIYVNLTNLTGVSKMNEKLSLGRLSVLSLQHVLAMYAGAIVAPIIVGWWYRPKSR
ncbi:hypothetical protein AZF37_00390 [endosymbiont 'TC1' of Trimyema compressum]|nr:hypothetical protein AZF37_00390 [endosymbiont 'TC1' of Trimyema compressum]